MPAIEEFVEIYSLATQGLSNLRLSEDEIAERVADLERLAGPRGQLESYTTEVFSDTSIRSAVSSIDAGLVNIQDGQARSRLTGMVNDLLIAACLVPVRETSKRDASTLGTSKVYNRQAIEIMPMALLTDTLVALKYELENGRSPLDDPDLGLSAYDESGPLDHRLAVLSLLNLRPATRAALVKNPTYQRLMASESLRDFLFAAGHDEQQFLSTCSVSAAGSDVRSRVPTLAGLVEIGRGTAREIEQTMSRLPPEILQQQERSAVFGGRRTLGELVRSRLTEAENEFVAIERALDAMAARSGRAPSRAEIDKLTARWSKVMQKLAAVAELSDGVSRVPVLSKKSIPGTWLANTVLSLPKGVDRPGRRLRGVSETYFESLSAQVETRTDLASGETKLVVDVIEAAGADIDRTVLVGAFWEAVRANGGTVVSTKAARFSGHDFYLKPVRRGEERVFALSDPKVSGYTYLDLDEFYDWARSKRIRVSDSGNLSYKTASLAIRALNRAKEADKAVWQIPAIAEQIQQAGVGTSTPGAREQQQQLVTTPGGVRLRVNDPAYSGSLTAEDLGSPEWPAFQQLLDEAFDPGATEFWVSREQQVWWAVSQDARIQVYASDGAAQLMDYQTQAPYPARKGKAKADTEEEQQTWNDNEAWEEWPVTSEKDQSGTGGNPFEELVKISIEGREFELDQQLAFEPSVGLTREWYAAEVKRSGEPSLNTFLAAVADQLVRGGIQSDKLLWRYSLAPEGWLVQVWTGDSVTSEFQAPYADPASPVWTVIVDDESDTQAGTAGGEWS